MSTSQYRFIGSAAKHNQETEGLLARLKSVLEEVLFEEAELDRPIGIRQLNHYTFQRTEEFLPYAHGRPGFYRDTRKNPFQDYRFARLASQSIPVSDHYWS